MRHLKNMALRKTMVRLTRWRVSPMGVAKSTKGVPTIRHAFLMISHAFLGSSSAEKPVITGGHRNQDQL